MIMGETSLWGDLTRLQQIRTPKTILVEQANILNQATKGVVRAEVASSGAGPAPNLSHALNLVAPALGNYTYTVATVIHDINIYPCKLLNPIVNRVEDCADEADLKRKLAAVLSDPKTLRVIESLLSQSR